MPLEDSWVTIRARSSLGNLPVVEQINPERFSLPVCENAYHNESVAFHHSVLLAEQRDMDDIVDAIIKIQKHVDEIV